MKVMVLEFFLCLSFISHVVFGLDDLVSCSGGSSLLGLDKWNSSFSLRCCDPSGSCHGYDAQSVAIKVSYSLQQMLNATLPIPKSIRFKKNFSSSQPTEEPSRLGARHEAVHVQSSDTQDEVVADSPVTPCCHSKVSVFYPITGISATSRRRVAVVQIGPFKQPVVYERCYLRKCRILRGNCIQVYAPQPLYILTTGEGGELAVKLDFILVEAGCQCQTRPVGDVAPLSSSMGVDASVPEALRIITGVDFDEDYFKMLASIDAASAIAGPNQATTLPTPAVAVATTTSTSNSNAPIIDPHELGNLATVIASTTSSTPFVSFQQTEMITSSSSPESSHDLSNGNEITSPTPQEWTSTTTTVLPLPELPEHGQPILILPGQFNPLLQFLKNFQENQL